MPPVIERLANQFENLRLKASSMAKLQDIQEALQEVLAKLRLGEEKQRLSDEKIASLTNSLSRFQIEQPTETHRDITTTITTGNDIQLESYKSIPEFSGEKSQYRSWREQVTRRMKMIEHFKTHPKYEAALGIIRSKVTKTASDILINNNTAYDIDAIIDRLDFSYSDQRPLYVVEAELTSIKQGNKSLQEYFDTINQALNMVITKIVMSYKSSHEQASLIAETKQKAIRTFTMGLKNAMTRSILYANTPKSLTQAFAISQTVFYDNQFLQLDQQHDANKPFVRTQRQHIPVGSNPNFNYAKMRQPTPPISKPEPMEVDTTNRFRYGPNWRQPNQMSNHQPNLQQSNQQSNQGQNLQTNAPQKREYDSSRQHIQPPKFQRINRMIDSESDPNEGYEGDICDETPDDLISISSHASDKTNTSSAFLAV